MVKNLSLEGMMLKLKLQCFGHLMRRTDSLEKTLMLLIYDFVNSDGNSGLPGCVPSMEEKGVCSSSGICKQESSCPRRGKLA